MDRIGTPFGFQSIIWTFVRHTVRKCLIFPALPEVAKVKSKSIHVTSSSSLPTGQYGWCFCYCFSGTLPLCSHLRQSIFRGLCPGVPSLNRLYSEIGKIHLSFEAQCGTACLPMGDCHNMHIANAYNRNFAHISLLHLLVVSLCKPSDNECYTL